MSIMTVEPAVLAALSNLTEQTELRDSQGNVLGYFTPRELEIRGQYEAAAKRFDPAEIRRRKASESGRGGKTTEELLEHLQSLERQ